MEVVLLCGGKGTRLGRESEVRPKPMVRVGERPILHHIMKHYSRYGHSDFILCLGYLGDVIRQYFVNYDLWETDFTVSLGEPKTITPHTRHDEHDWKVTLAETGADNYTGARVKLVERYVKGDTFMLTYGDGVSDVDLDKLVGFHRSHGKVATVTVVHPPARFGELTAGDGGIVTEFSEKPQTSQGRINGGFFVCQREFFDYITTDPQCSLEHKPMNRLVADGELMAYEHDGFWQCVDTVRELDLLNAIWASGQAPWKTWA